MSEIKVETVDRTITVKLPKEFDDFLQILAKASDSTIEEELASQLYGVLRDFYQGGHWDDYLEKLGNRFDRLVSQVMQTRIG